MPRFRTLHHRPYAMACAAASLAMLCAPALAQQDQSAPVLAPTQAPAAQGAAAPKPSMPVADFGSCAKPVYPIESLRYEQEGTVTLAFLIGTDGLVKESKIVKTSGFPLLDMAAQDGIARCKFKPSRLDGQPRDAWMKMQYVWTFDNLSPAQAAAELEAARKGAERGDAAHQYMLAKINRTPGSLAYQPAEGMALLRKSAEQGYLPAQLSLGTALQFGDVVPANPEEAMRWLRKAAESGSAQGQHAMALLHWERGGAADMEAARAWLRKAVAQDYAPSQAFYGALLMQDPAAGSVEQGLALLRKAEAKNQGTAQLALAQAYQAGNGVPRDDAQALVLFEKAARNGVKPAQRELARRYEQGQGVAADPAKAARWREIAASAPAQRR